MHDRTISIWHEEAYKPYISTLEGESALLFDDYICHNDASLKKAIEADGGIRIMILPHYTCILQQFDVVLLSRLRKDSSGLCSDCVENAMKIWNME